MDDERAIREILADVEAAWLHGPPSDIVARIATHVAADAIIVGPDLTRVARGREAFCRSYADFVAAASIEAFVAEPPGVDCSGNVSVATVAWQMRYTLGETTATEAGADIVVLRRTGGRWQIVWRKIESRPVASG